MADVDEVQLWLVLLSGWAANEEGVAEEEREEEAREGRAHALDEVRRGEDSRGTV